MKKISLSVLFLILASLACNWGGPSLAQPAAPTPQEVTQPQATENVLLVPNVEAGGGIEATRSVFMPNVSGGESSQAAQPEGSTAPEPYVEMAVSAESIQVGGTITITGTPVGLGLPYYYLAARDEGVQDVLPMAQVTHDNAITALEGSSSVVAYTSATGSPQQVVFVLTGIAPGVTTITITATGEVHRADGTLWQAAGSGDIFITVVP